MGTRLNCFDASNSPSWLEPELELAMMIGGNASAGVFDICLSSSTNCSSCLSDLSIERRKMEGSSVAIGVFASRACAADTFDTSTCVDIFVMQLS